MSLTPKSQPSHAKACSLTDSFNASRFCVTPFCSDGRRNKINHFCTIGGESADLKQLFSSDFVYVMLVIYYVPIALVLAITVLAQKCRK